jgi:hypothetical protein
MEAYRLYAVVPYLVHFIEDLTNIYVRYNRKRLKGGRGAADEEVALATLFDTLLKVRAQQRTAVRCLPWQLGASAVCTDSRIRPGRNAQRSAALLYSL